MAIPTDTSPRAEAVQLGLLREAPVWRRLELARQLTKLTHELSWGGWCRRFPDLPDDERVKKWFEFQYGPDLASRVFRSRP